MASGYVNRVKRPNTWLHRPMLQNVKKALANPEPSTHDPTRTLSLEHDPEKWESVFRKDHVQTKGWTTSMIQPS
jgi:hypothetical protein